MHITYPPARVAPLREAAPHMPLLPGPHLGARVPETGVCGRKNAPQYQVKITLLIVHDQAIIRLAYGWRCSTHLHFTRALYYLTDAPPQAV